MEHQKWLHSSDLTLIPSLKARAFPFGKAVISVTKFGIQCYEQYLAIKKQVEVLIEQSIGSTLYQQIKKGLSMNWKQ